MTQHALFRNGRLDDYLAERRSEAKQFAQKLPEAQLRSVGVDAVTAELTAKYRVGAIALRPGDKWMDEPTEVDVNVSHHQNFSSFGRAKRGTATAPGMRYVIHVPFDGDAKLFELQPNMQSSMYPRADVKGQQGHLDLIVDVPSVDEAPPAITTKLNRELGLLDSYSNAQVPLITEFNSKLVAEIRQVFETRLSHLEKTKAAIAAIGIHWFPRLALRGYRFLWNTRSRSTMHARRTTARGRRQSVRSATASTRVS
jgi:hypothetical protein